MRSLVLLLLLSVSAHAWISDPPLPAIPRTSRILTVEDVETFWFNVLRRTEIPRRPSALHPEQQRQWDAKIAAFKRHLRRILNGEFRDEAEVAMLRHNIVAWDRKGKAREAEECRKRLRAVLEHQALVKSLVAQEVAARRTAHAAERQARAIEHLASSTPAVHETTIVVEHAEAHCPPPDVHVHPTPAPQPPPPPERVVPTIPTPDPPPRPFCPVGSPR